MSELGYGMLFGSDVKKKFFQKRIKGRGYCDVGTSVISEFYTPLVPKGHDFLKRLAGLQVKGRFCLKNKERTMTMWWNNENNARRTYSNKAGRGQQRVQDRVRPACCGARLALRHRHCPSVSNRGAQKQETVQKSRKRLINSGLLLVLRQSDNAYKISHFIRWE